MKLGKGALLLLWFLSDIPLPLLHAYRYSGRGGLIAGGQPKRARERKDRGVGWDRKQGRSSRREKRGEDRSESEMAQQGQKATTYH